MNCVDRLSINDGLNPELLQLRASTSLARLRRDQGKRTEPRDLLTPIYGWFTEGFGAAVLREARSLLDELA
jgi:predicted ATPase